jgi:multidrug efflux pump
MIFSEVSIRRPVLATMMNLALVLFGLVALPRLPVRELPDIDPPIVNVTTIYPGANAEVVETEVTERLEEVINSIEGIKTLSSESREQVSSVTIEFDLARPIEEAAQDVRDRVSRVRGNLPEDIEEPVVAKQDADAQPMLWIALFSEQYSTLELTSIAENLMKDRLQTVKGVSSIFIGGGKRFAMRLRLDAEKMAAHQVTVQDVETALRRQSVELPSGRVEGWDRELTIQTLGELKTADEFNQLVIRPEGDGFVRLADVGLAEVGAEDERSIARFNSQPAVGLGIVKQSKANTIEVARGIRAELDRLKPFLPAGLQTFVPYDESVYVEESIREVWITLGIAFVLVVLTIFVFLRNVRSTLIPGLTIPVSIICTFLVLHALGYSINILTMLALVLAIGIVVDDSIVVLENIYRHIEEGRSPFEAALLGMREIGFAVVAVTLSLVAVFIPLAFQTTITGRLFVEFAIALCASVLISAFVALSLTPMAASRLLKPVEEVRHGSLFYAFERGFDRLSRHYERLLGWALRHRRTVALCALGLVALTAAMYRGLAKDFLPEEDKGRLLCFGLAPEGATSEYTDRIVRRMEAIAAATPETAGYFSAVALARGAPGKANEGLMFMRLREDRKRGVVDIVGGPHGIGAQFSRIEGAFAIPIIPKAIGRGFSQPFQLVIQNQDFRELERQTEEVAERLRVAGFLANVRSNYEINKPELRVRIDRDRAAALGVSVEDISRTLQILFGGLDLSRIKQGGKEYKVMVQLQRETRLTPADLDRLYVRNDRGELVQISSVVQHQVGAGPSAIYHYNRFRSATLEATPVGVALGRAIEQVEDMLRPEVAAGLRYSWTGEADSLKEAGRGFLFMIILGSIIVYMVLASQFESLLHPLTIMLTLPLAAFGALGGLWIMSLVDGLGNLLYAWSHFAPDPPALVRGLSAVVPRVPAMNINLFSQIGMVLLLGLATKNSILLVEFANQQRAQGRSAMEAMMAAGKLRFRPILMTSFSTILGILPIAIGLGAGAESRRPMGVAATSGLLISTFLTLLLVPVAYTIFSDWAERLKRWRAPRRAAGVLLAVLLAAGAAGTAGGQAPETETHPSPVEAYDLERCLATALARNFAIRQARERINRETGAYVEVRARRLPRVQLLGQYDTSDEGRVNSFGAGELSDENWLIQVELTQSLYAGGGNRAAGQRQALLKEAAVTDLGRAIQDALLEVREAYYAVLLTRSEVHVQEQNVQLLEEELQTAQNRFDSGVVSSFEVLRADVALANGQTPLIRARNTYRLALEDLSRLMGLEDGVFDAGRPPLEVAGQLEFTEAAVTLDEALTAARENRLELKGLRQQVEAQRQGVRESRADYRPSVDGFVNYGAEHDRTSSTLSDEVSGWMAGVRAAWDLFDSGETRGRVLQSISALESVHLDEAEARLNIDNEVRRAHASLFNARELVKATRKVVEQAVEGLRLARSRHAVGAATQLDVFSSQVQLTQARSNENQALHDYSIVVARLKKAMGLTETVVLGVR